MIGFEKGSQRRATPRSSRLILDTIPGLVAVLKPSGEVDAANHELVTFCGQPLEAMKDSGTNGTVHPDDLPHMVPIFTRAIASGEPYDFEARRERRKVGQPCCRPVILTCSAAGATPKPYYGRASCQQCISQMV
jgi:PAS domain-containing protein